MISTLESFQKFIGLLIKWECALHAARIGKFRTSFLKILKSVFEII